MKVKLLFTGKTDFDFIEKGISMYSDRISHYLPFGISVIPDIKNTKTLTPEQIKTKEGEAQLSRLKESDAVILLDDKGKEFTSVEFSNFINKKMNTGKNIVFIIGGAYGFSKSLYTRANEKISLSKLTYSHQIVRVIFLEQLYRGLTILKHEKYHHE